MGYRYRRPAQHRRPADQLAVITLLLIGVGLPTVLAIASGSLGIPHNDDFSFARQAIGLYRTGQIEWDRWAAMALVGQTLLSQPFLWLSGGATWSLGIFGLVWSAVAVVAAYALARQFLAVMPSLLVGLVMVLIPGYLRTTSTFMTDVPCLALVLVSLLLGVIGADRGFDWRYLAASLATGLLGVSIREIALAAPVAVLVVTAFAATSWRPVVLAMIAFGLGVAAVLLAANAVHGGVSGVPANDPPDPIVVMSALVTLGALLTPVLAVAAARTRTRLLILGASIVVLVLDGFQPGMLLGNLWTSDGMLGQAVLVGPRPILFGDPAWSGIRWVATIGAIALVVLVGEAVVTAVRRLPLAPTLLIDEARLRIGSPLGVVAVFAVVFGAGITAVIALSNPLDRYLWELVPVASILLLVGATSHLQGVSRVGLLGAGLGVVFLAGVAGLLALNSTAYDVARWRMGETAVSRGDPAGLVDAGYEWVGAHAVGQAHARGGAFTWYEDLWSRPQPCAVVSNGPIADPRLQAVEVETVAYRLFWLGGTEQPLYLYETGMPGCSSGTNP